MRIPRPASFPYVLAPGGLPLALLMLYGIGELRRYALPVLLEGFYEIVCAPS
jgi:hypothetical protein